MQVSCEHCGRVYDSTLTRNGGLERCAKCNKLNLFLPEDELNHVVFGDYIILEKIGVGGNAMVVKAKHLQTNDIFALKLFFSDSESDEDHSTMEFLSEIEVASQLVHENIVRIYSGEERDNILYLVMEYVDGMNLAEYLETYGAMPPYDAMAVGIHTCHAMDHVWSNNLMIHRDVKPQNIMINSDGDIKLCDFGLISQHESAYEDNDTIIGTPYYVSPEMVDSSTYQDNKSDIYSLGATLFHIMAGVPPFNYGGLLEVLNARINHPPPKLSDFLPNLPPGLSEVIETMMSTDPDDRYITATEAAEDILRVRDGVRPQLVDKNREKLNQ